MHVKKKKPAPPNPIWLLNSGRLRVHCLWKLETRGIDGNDNYGNGKDVCPKTDYGLESRQSEVVGSFDCLLLKLPASDGYKVTFNPTAYRLLRDILFEFHGFSLGGKKCYPRGREFFFKKIFLSLMMLREKKIARQVGLREVRYR